jgi:hypothetical protein
MQDISLIGVPHFEVLNMILCLPISQQWNSITIMLADDSDNQQHIHNIQWAEIDAVLDSPRFHMLQSFGLAGWLDVAQQKLPLANARGIVRWLD